MAIMRSTLIILLAQIVLFSLGTLANDDCQNKCKEDGTCNAKKISNVCYYIFKEKRTWLENKNVCDKEGLKMGKISEDQLYNFNIQDLMTDLDPNAYAWLGGHAQDLDSWTFLNNVTVGETSANVPPEPTDGQEMHLCGVVSDDGTLDKDDCRNMKYFICRFADWRGIATYYVSELPVTWYEAGARCLKLGGSLFSLKEKEDTNFLKLKLTSQSFKDQKLFLGLTKRRWVWQDGEYIIHYNWRDKEPNKISEKCINVIPRDGVWNDADCNEKFYTLCQGEVTIPAKEPDKESSEGGIPMPIFIVVIVMLVIAIIAVVPMAIWIWKKKRYSYSPNMPSKDSQKNPEEGKPPPIKSSTYPWNRPTPLKTNEEIEVSNPLLNKQEPSAEQSNQKKDNLEKDKKQPAKESFFRKGSPTTNVNKPDQGKYGETKSEATSQNVQDTAQGYVKENTNKKEKSDLGVIQPGIINSTRQAYEKQSSKDQQKKDVHGKLEEKEKQEKNKDKTTALVNESAKIMPKDVETNDIKTPQDNSQVSKMENLATSEAPGAGNNQFSELETSERLLPCVKNLQNQYLDQVDKHVNPK